MIPPEARPVRETQCFVWVRLERNSSLNRKITHFFNFFFLIDIVSCSCYREKILYLCFFIISLPTPPFLHTQCLCCCFLQEKKRRNKRDNILPSSCSFMCTAKQLFLQPSTPSQNSLHLSKIQATLVSQMTKLINAVDYLWDIRRTR